MANYRCPCGIGFESRIGEWASHLEWCEIAKLEAERDRYKAALEEIAGMLTESYQAKIAREALNPKSSQSEGK